MDIELFSIQQRYNFESNSQITMSKALTGAVVFQYNKDIILKAIHNTFGVSEGQQIVVFNTTKIQF